MLFTELYARWPGRVRDARVFRRSGLQERLRNNMIRHNQHIVGDCAYPLRKYLLAPYKGGSTVAQP